MKTVFFDYLVCQKLKMEDGKGSCWREWLFKSHFLPFHFFILPIKHIQRKTKTFSIIPLFIIYIFYVISLFHPSNQTNPKHKIIKQWSSKMFDLSQIQCAGYKCSNIKSVNLSLKLIFTNSYKNNIPTQIIGRVYFQYYIFLICIYNFRV